MVSFSLDISKIFRHFCEIRDGDWLARFLSNFLLSCFLVFLACFLAGTSDGWTQGGVLSREIVMSRGFSMHTSRNIGMDVLHDMPKRGCLKRRASR